MLSKLLRKRQILTKIAAQVLVLAVLLGTALPAFALFLPVNKTQPIAEGALSGLTVEQVRADMPQVRVVAYDTAAAAEPDAYLDGTPLTYEKTIDSSEMGISYIVMLDVSGSIRAEYFNAARQQVLALAGRLGPNDEVTLITFGDTVTLQASGCRTAGELDSVLNALTARDQKTRLYEAIDKGLEYAEASDGSKRQVMLIVSDGIQDTGSVGITREEIESRLEAANMPVYSFCVDYAGRAAQEEFGRFARTTGGTFSAFSPADAVQVWQEWEAYLNQAVVYCYAAGSNRVDGKAHTVLLRRTESDTNYSRQVTLADWVPDTEAPVISDYRYNAKAGTLTLTFSEPVLGAEDPASYEITSGGKKLAPASVTVLEDGRYQLALPDSVKHGTVTVTCSGIRDDSMEENPLADSGMTFQKPLAFRDFLPWIIGGVVVVFAAVLIFVLARKKTRKVQYEVQHIETTPGKPREDLGDMGAPGTTARLEFEIIGGRQAGQNFDVKVYKSAIWGRSKEMCDVCLDDQRISRQQCVMELENGQIRVTDLGSSNGTYINGIRLTAPAPLRPGDRLQIGDTCLKVWSIWV